MFGDTVKGNTRWTIKRTDYSFEDILYQLIEDEARRMKPLEVWNQDPKFMKWALHQLMTTQAYKIEDHVKVFGNPHEVAPYVDPTLTKCLLLGRAKTKADKIFESDIPFYDVEIIRRNLFLNEGINEILDIIGGQAGITLYDNANAELGIGENAGAPVATQTDLLGATTLFKAMDATFPTVSASQSSTWRATFGTAEALFNVLEQSIRNGLTRNRNMQRSNTNLGDKTLVTETWVISGDISLA